MGISRIMSLRFEGVGFRGFSVWGLESGGLVWDSISGRANPKP